jgi:hypothetical protein
MHKLMGFVSVCMTNHKAITVDGKRQEERWTRDGLFSFVCMCSGGMLLKDHGDESQSVKKTDIYIYIYIYMHPSIAHFFMTRIDSK